MKLLEQGWTLSDIDEMDVFYYFDILIYRSIKEYKQNLNSVLNIL
ncbi:hypothetical protein [Clostridium chromiireducens]|nr:hypothetical protein [Clostridium chromiireducens]